MDEFDLIDMSRYTDPIAIVIKFRRGLDPLIQNKIAESSTERPDKHASGGGTDGQCHEQAERSVR